MKGGVYDRGRKHAERNRQTGDASDKTDLGSKPHIPSSRLINELGVLFSFFPASKIDTER